MKNQSGSAIVMLFIAVALFGALAYAFMKGSRTSTGFLTDEQAKTNAQQLIAYANDMKSAVKRLQLRGCKDNAISFTNNVWHGTGTSTPYFGVGHNPNASTDGKCDVFTTNGAGLSPKLFENVAIETGSGAWAAGSGGPAVVKIENIGTANPELVFYLDKIKEDVCLKINQTMALNFTSVPTDPFGAWIPYNAGFTNYSSFGYVGDDNAALAGKTTFCVSSGGNNVFHSVLIPR